MRIAIAGAGAIGGFLAGALAKAGSEVSVVARGPHLQAIRERGLTVRSTLLGEFTVSLAASDDLRDFGELDVAIAAFKAHQWPGAIEQFAALAGTATAIVTMQNGFPFWYFREYSIPSVDPAGELRATFQDDQLIGGVIHASGHIVEPGVVAHLGNFTYPIGEAGRGISARVQELSTILESAGLRSPVADDIRQPLWRKLFGNVALNAPSALTRATTQTMLRDERTRVLLEAMVAEAFSVAVATGIELGFTTKDVMEHMSGLADVKTSMLQDLEAGRSLELEPILGAVVELAGAFDVAVPHLESVYACARLLRDGFLADAGKTHRA